LDLYDSLTESEHLLKDYLKREGKYNRLYTLYGIERVKDSISDITGVLSNKPIKAKCTD
jgi:hypothetical protein